jgi:phytoene dehydrogenase-like protein
LTEGSLSAERASRQYDVVVVGAGPNGLAAAIACARAGLATLVVEASDTPGGGARSAPLTLPGFVHDVCSTVHPLARASPFFQTLALERFGLSWVESPAPLVHMLDNGELITLERSIAETALQLGPDASAYQRLLEPLVTDFAALMRQILGPLRPSLSPLLVRFGLAALQSLSGFARREFSGEEVRALLAGNAAHSMLRLDALASASFALVLASAAHAVGWPVARGGSQSLTNALVACLREHGGELVLGRYVRRLSELPRARAYLLDVAPKQLLAIAGDKLPLGYRRRLGRYVYGPGAFKVDWALAGPIPWKTPLARRAITVHLSGSLEQLEASEAAVHTGRLTPLPFTLLTQPSLFDPSRAPAGRHTAWAYCHVPHASRVDATELIEGHIERYAPGFRELVLGRSTKSALDLERYDPNYVGGDINCGLSSLSQLFFRPVARFDPYTTPAPDVFICSSATPPGGGVHGMCGYWAAKSALRRVFGRQLEL